MGILTGQSRSSSSNQNNGLLTSALGPVANLAGTAGNAISGLLTGGDTTGFNNFKNNAGFNFQANQGATGITGNAAARGLLNSGGTQKALANFGQGLNSSMIGQYLQSLLGMGQMGNQAGGVLAQAGQTSQGNSKGGLGSIWH